MSAPACGCSAPGCPRRSARRARRQAAERPAAPASPDSPERRPRAASRPARTTGERVNPASSSLRERADPDARSSSSTWCGSVATVSTPSSSALRVDAVACDGFLESGEVLSGEAFDGGSSARKWRLPFSVAVSEDWLRRIRRCVPWPPTRSRLPSISTTSRSGSRSLASSAVQSPQNPPPTTSRSASIDVSETPERFRARERRARTASRRSAQPPPESVPRMLQFTSVRRRGNSPHDVSVVSLGGEG